MLNTEKSRKRHGWTKEAMKEAIDKIRKGEMTAYHAQKVYSIPKQSLSDRLTGKVELNAKLGRPTALTTTEENEIVERCILTASKRNIESVVINTPENNPSTCALAEGTVSTSSGSTPGSLRDFLGSYFKHRHPEELHNSLGNVLLDLGSLTGEEVLERARKEEDRKQKELEKEERKKLREKKKMNKMKRRKKTKKEKR